MEKVKSLYTDKPSHFRNGEMILTPGTLRHWEAGLTFNEWLTLIHLTARGAPSEFFERPPFNRSTQWRVRNALVRKGFILEGTRIWPDGRSRKGKTAYGITTS